MRDMLRWLPLCLAVNLVGACVPPMTPAERLSYSANELASAARFGRMDIALGHVRADRQLEFARRRVQWGKDIRIVDVEMQGMRMLSDERAEVQLVLSWHRLNETTIRVTTVAQEWVQGGEDWRLASEQRTGGPKGLFTEPKPAKAKAKTEDEG